MSRAFIGCIRANELEWQVPKGGSAGVVAKILSVDLETGACTRLISIPPGWKKDNRGACYHEAAEEMLFFSGDVTLDEAYTLTAGCYFYRPAGLVHGNVERSENGCSGITISDGRIEWHSPGHFPGGKYAGEYLVAESKDPVGHIKRLDTNRLEWHQLASGILQKTLSKNKVTGAKTALIKMLPGWSGGNLHFHYCLEELFVMEGSVVVDGTTAYSAGTYACHPPRVVHGGNERSDEGALIFVKHHRCFESIKVSDISEEKRRELIWP